MNLQREGRRDGGREGLTEMCICLDGVCWEGGEAGGWMLAFLEAREDRGRGGGRERKRESESERGGPMYA